MTGPEARAEYDRLDAELRAAEQAAALARARVEACQARLHALQARCPHPPTDPYRDECPWCFKASD